MGLNGWTPAFRLDSGMECAFGLFFTWLVGGMRVVRLLLSNTLELLLVGRKDLGQGPSFPPLKWV